MTNDRLHGPLLRLEQYARHYEQVGDAAIHNRPSSYELCASILASMADEALKLSEYATELAAVLRERVDVQ